MWIPIHKLIIIIIFLANRLCDKHVAHEKPASHLIVFSLHNNNKRKIVAYSSS